MYKKTIERANENLEAAGNQRCDWLDVLRGLLLQMGQEVETIGRKLSKTEVGSPLNFFEEVERFEIELIQSALRRTGGHQKRAAKLLGIQHTTLNSKIKRYRIPWRFNQEPIEGKAQTTDRAAAQWNN